MRDDSETPAYILRPMGAVNWIGVWSLYLKEVRRFLKVAMQTLLAPIVTTLLFLAIFTLALGRADWTVSGVDFTRFLAPGLVMMAIIQNAFANNSSSLIIAKVQGNIVDFLMPPLTAGELTFAFAMGGITRGLVVGTIVYLAMLPFVDIGLHHLGYTLFYAASASLCLSLLGLVAGIWGEKFDHLSAVTNFIIMPMSFLSGTFYSVERLPGDWVLAAHLNPFFYMIDGLRYGLIGHSEGSLATGVVLLCVLNLLLWIACRWMFVSGWRLKP